ncbi:MAG: ATP-binding cassette domain-containing protein, partial [Bacteroidota bacterium]|nr:ATP-binding cassette domain-containing protein [Bacteroidota bacterium]
MLPDILQVKDLTLTTVHGSIVSDITFSIAPAEIVALTGPSGSGKSSIAHAILGLLPPGMYHQTGSISIKLKDGTSKSLPTEISKWDQIRGSIVGFVQQDMYGAFDPVMKMGKQINQLLRERSAQEYSDIEVAIKDRMIEIGLKDVHRIYTSY